MLNDQDVEKLASHFYGYGAYDTDYWLIGKEEGGGKLADVSRRVQNWHQRGANELEDLVDFHHAIDVTRFWGERPALQPTWNRLIRIILSAERASPKDRHVVREFQANQLGRSRYRPGDRGTNCLLELLPLPSPSTGRWAYREWSRLPQLQTREIYGDYYASIRSRHLRGRVEQFGPKAVIFYSTDSWYRRYWEVIAGTDFKVVSLDGFDAYFGQRGKTVFAIVNHPTRHGVTNDYFHRVGEVIADLRDGDANSER